jgi:dTDP-4-dehydrorhamnose 3,5-epimerase-like enzyme
MTPKSRNREKRWFSGAARLVGFKRHEDERGALLPIEFDRLPFMPLRVFTVAGVPAGTVRGGHGHRVGQQLLICLQGQIETVLRHGHEEARATLLPDGTGLLIGPNVWCSQTYMTADSVLLVLASEPYDPASYFKERE